ncbi:PaaI family thioesterase [Tessaracoccus sp. OH4464_COT-324]|nr:PaaI family thioesterase [Tessaracoccus sp. OH4464_COT-324]
MASPFDQKLGLELVELSPQRVVGWIPVAGNVQPFGRLHGGASATLIETLASLGATAHGKTLGLMAVGLDLHVTHLGSARSGTVYGTATAVRLGRRVAAYRVDVTDDASRLISTGTLNCMLVPTS